MSTKKKIVYLGGAALAVTLCVLAYALFKTHYLSAFEKERRSAVEMAREGRHSEALAALDYLIASGVENEAVWYDYLTILVWSESYQQFFEYIDKAAFEDAPDFFYQSSIDVLRNVQANKKEFGSVVINKLFSANKFIKSDWVNRGHDAAKDNKLGRVYVNQLQYLSLAKKVKFDFLWNQNIHESRQGDFTNSLIFFENEFSKNKENPVFIADYLTVNNWAGRHEEVVQFANKSEQIIIPDYGQKAIIDSREKLESLKKTPIESAEHSEIDYSELLEANAPNYSVTTKKPNSDAATFNLSNYKEQVINEAQINNEINSVEETFLIKQQLLSSRARAMLSSQNGEYQEAKVRLQTLLNYDDVQQSAGFDLMALSVEVNDYETFFGRVKESDFKKLPQHGLEASMLVLKDNSVNDALQKQLLIKKLFESELFVNEAQISRVNSLIKDESLSAYFLTVLKKNMPNHSIVFNENWQSAVKDARDGRHDNAISFFDKNYNNHKQNLDFVADYLVINNWAGKHQKVIKTAAGFDFRELPIYSQAAVAHSYKLSGKLEEALIKYEAIKSNDYSKEIEIIKKLLENKIVSYSLQKPGGGLPKDEKERRDLIANQENKYIAIHRRKTNKTQAEIDYLLEVAKEAKSQKLFKMALEVYDEILEFHEYSDELYKEKMLLLIELGKKNEFLATYMLISDELKSETVIQYAAYDFALDLKNPYMALHVLNGLDKKAPLVKLGIKKVAAQFSELNENVAALKVLNDYAEYFSLEEETRMLAAVHNGRRSNKSIDVFTQPKEKMAVAANSLRYLDSSEKNSQAMVVDTITTPRSVAKNKENTSQVTTTTQQERYESNNLVGLTKRLKQNPNDTVLYNQWLTTIKKDENYNDLVHEELVYKMHEQFPLNSLLNQDYITFLSWNEKHTEALEQYGKSRFTHPKDYMLKAVAQSAKETGNLNLALMLYRGLYDENKDLDSKIGELNVQFELHEYLEIIGQYKKFKPQEKRNRDLLLITADSYIRDKKFANAILMFDELLVLDEQDQTAYVRKVLTLADAGLPFVALEMMDDQIGYFEYDHKTLVLNAMNTYVLRLASDDSIPEEQKEDIIFANNINQRYVNHLKMFEPENHKQITFAFADRLVILGLMKDHGLLTEIYLNIKDKYKLPTYAKNVAAGSFLTLRNPEMALDIAEEILEIDEKNYNALNVAYYANLELENYKDAEDHLSTLDEIVPVWLYSEDGKRSLDNPNRSTTELMKSMHIAFKNRLGSGLEVLEDLVSRAPANNEYWVNRAKLYRWRELFEEADESLRIVENTDKNYVLRDIEHTSLLLAQRKYKAAHELYSKLLASFPENDGVNNLTRDFEIHNKNIFSINGRKGRSKGSRFASNDEMFETYLYSKPLKFNWRAFAFKDHTHAEYLDTEEGVIYRQGVGGDFRNNHLEATAKIYDVERHDPLEFSLDGTWRLDDHWFVSAGYQSFSDETPVRAFDSGVTADSKHLGVRYRHDELYNYELSGSHLSFSDGNNRSQLLLSAYQPLFRNEHNFLSLWENGFYQKNSEDKERNYYNPKSLYSFTLALDYTGYLNRRYERAYLHSARLGAGVSKEDGFKRTPILYFDYLHKWELSRAMTLHYGIGYALNHYDGEREKGPNFKAGIEYKF